MNNKLYAAIIAAVALLFGAVAYCYAQSDDYLATCVRVIDGDTLTVAY